MRVRTVRLLGRNLPEDFNERVSQGMRRWLSDPAVAKAHAERARITISKSNADPEFQKRALEARVKKCS